MVTVQAKKNKKFAARKEKPTAFDDGEVRVCGNGVPNVFCWMLRTTESQLVCRPTLPRTMQEMQQGSFGLGYCQERGRN